MDTAKPTGLSALSPGGVAGILLLNVDQPALPTAQGIKAITRRRPESVRRIPPDNPEILLDLNTPEQYRAALAANAP